MHVSVLLSSAHFRSTLCLNFFSFNLVVNLEFIPKLEPTLACSPTVLGGQSAKCSGNSYQTGVGVAILSVLSRQSTKVWNSCNTQSLASNVCPPSSSSTPLALSLLSVFLNHLHAT